MRTAIGTLDGPRVLSIRQPWAWAISQGRKKVENRTWSTSYRGVVYIHASLKLERDGLTWLSSKAKVQPPSQFVFGAVVAVAVLSDVVTRRTAKRFRPWFFGPYGFVLRKVRVLRNPVNTKGRLGLFRASPALVRAVNRQL
jgi:hypothetical protein